MNWWLLEKLGKTQQREILRQTNLNRIYGQVGVPHYRSIKLTPSIILFELGKIFIDMGNRLQLNQSQLDSQYK